MNEKEMYLVSYVGIYKENEGDHTSYLFGNYKDAKRKFDKCVNDAKKYYEKELGSDFNEYTEEDEDFYSLRTCDEVDFVDIWITEIKCDGSMSSITF